jgi:hypothetical protein
MYYRVESLALPKARTFKDLKKAVNFAKSLAEKTAHEVTVRAIGKGYFTSQELYTFNKKPY